MSREAWFKPKFDIVGFLPPTPGGALVKGIQKIVQEEGEKIGLNIRVTEQSGLSVSSMLTTPDLSGCLFPRCTITEGGASHSRRGANYTGTCLVCGDLYRVRQVLVHIQELVNTRKILEGIQSKIAWLSTLQRTILTTEEIQPPSSSLLAKLATNLC